MRPIETSYAGYKFRSRLEARWAVFFDRAGFEWEYEVEGFHLDDGRMYLPDFRVLTPQGAVVWYEVKPTHAADDGKFNAFLDALPGMVRGAVLVGDPWQQVRREGDWVLNLCPRCGLIADRGWWIEPHACGDTVDVGCMACDVETPCGRENADTGLYDVPLMVGCGVVSIWRDDYRWLARQVESAALGARGERFDRRRQVQRFPNLVC